MKQLLDHLAESGIYTEADLQPFGKRLGELREIIRRDTEQGKHPPQLTKLMMRKLEGCRKVLEQLQGTLSVLSVELVPIHQKLVSIRRQIAAAAAKPKPARHEIRKLQEELRSIDGKRVDGKFLGPGGSSVPAGQAILVGLLEECFEICHDVVIRNDEVPMTLQPIYDRLTEIKGQLEHLVLTHRWTLRETDLWNYQVTLKEIDRLRVDGKFVDSEGKQPEGQLVLLYLLRRCYGLIYRLVASSEPISEELMPISNKLSTVSKCLKEVSKYGGPFSARDLYPYRLALHQIENMKSPVLDKEGKETGVRKWLGRDGSVPEGQAILRAQFEELEQTINEMLNREEDSDVDDDDEEADVSDGWGSDATGSISEEEDEEQEDDDMASQSAGMTSGLYSRDRSMPTSPTGDLPGSPSISFISESGYLSPGGFGVTAPRAASPGSSSVGLDRAPGSADSLTTATATRAPQSIPGSSSPHSIPPPVISTASTEQSTVLPGTSSNLLPPGAATLAVPTPGQASLTAAAVSLDSLSQSPSIGASGSTRAWSPSSNPVSDGSSPPALPVNTAIPRSKNLPTEGGVPPTLATAPLGALPPALQSASAAAAYDPPSALSTASVSDGLSATGASLAESVSSSGTAGATTSSAGVEGAAATSNLPVVRPEDLGASPGSVASKKDLADELKAKLAMEES